jgi:hypothetical protein
MENDIEMRNIQPIVVLPAMKNNNGLMNSCFAKIFLNRHIKTRSCALTLFRIIAICLGLICMVFDTIAFANTGGVYQKFRTVRFIVGGNYVYYEIATMIYASGAAAFGTTIDFVIALSLSVVNCILVHVNCQNSSLRNVSIFLVIRNGVFYLFVELCYRNFKQLPKYEDAFRKSASSMLRQTLLFSFTALFLTASGLKTVHRNTVRKEQSCPYLINQCGLVELYEPQFEEGHPCEDDLIEYITSREELRIIRNLTYIHIAFYSMFNNKFLKVSNDIELHVLRVLLICLFALLSTSVVYSNVTPYRFLKGAKTFYDISEAVFFLSLLIMLGYQWYKKVYERISRYDLTQWDDAHTVGMAPNPDIL